MNLKVIIGSTRPQRIGASVAKWFVEFAEQHSDFSIEILDLKEIDLPLLDEVHHPKLANYQNTHSQIWSEKIEAGDAFVMVTPEYNHSMPAALKNALDYLFKEWREKPVGFISYGGASGGMRAVQALKGPVATLSMVPLTQAVNIHHVAEFIDKDGNLKPDEPTREAGKALLYELERWGKALKYLREEL